MTKSQSSLSARLRQAIEQRATLIGRLHSEGTNCYRLFHGIAEGWPGLTIDRYGEFVLIQTFRDPLTSDEFNEVREILDAHFGLTLPIVMNHRGQDGNQAIPWHDPGDAATQRFVVLEHGMKVGLTPRHRGQDPHMFLDFRSGRRWIAEHAEGTSVLNLFAYTCTAGLAAALGGASEVWNVDFSQSALDIGQRNFESNDIAISSRFLKEDVFPVLWQLAGRGVRGRARRNRFTFVERRQFDLVVLDPPTWSKGRFGAVDLVEDYPSLLKPALLATRSGGWLLATNHVASVDRETWEAVLMRTLEKTERKAAQIEWIPPGDDFPSFDGAPPLKIAAIQVT